MCSVDIPHLLQPWFHPSQRLLPITLLVAIPVFLTDFWEGTVGRNNETYNCSLRDSDLLKYGLHGGREIGNCQRCERSVCEAHSVISREFYDRLVFCSRCSALVA